jgi:hypothetical protein
MLAGMAQNCKLCASAVKLTVPVQALTVAEDPDWFQKHT